MFLRRCGLLNVLCTPRMRPRTIRFFINIRWPSRDLTALRSNIFTISCSFCSPQNQELFHAKGQSKFLWGSFVLGVIKIFPSIFHRVFASIFKDVEDIKRSGNTLLYPADYWNSYVLHILIHGIWTLNTINFHEHVYYASYRKLFTETGLS